MMPFLLRVATMMWVSVVTVVGLLQWRAILAVGEAVIAAGFGPICVAILSGVLAGRLALGVWNAVTGQRRIVAHGTEFGSSPRPGFARPVARVVVVDEAELRGVARHEAAHAVVCLAGGGCVEVAHVIPDGRFSGRVFSADPDDWGVADRLWLQLKVALAGNLVDLEAGIHDESSTSDWMRAWALASALASCATQPAGCAADAWTCGSILDAARAEAGRCLQLHRGWVDRVTDALVERRQLDGGEISALRSGDLR